MPIVCGLALLLSGAVGATPELAWSGTGRHRVLVRVEAAPAEQLGAGRDQRIKERVDERPAEARLEFAKLLAAAGITDVPDPATFQVIRHDPQTGRPIKPGPFAFARGEFDIPFRWYDAAIPYDFPECEVNVATSEGKLRWINRPRTGYFFECVGDAHDGRLAFTHRDDGREAWYAVYFDTIADGKLPAAQPPRGFVGDGLNRCEPVGHSTTGLIHNRVDVVDFDGDSLPDLLIGCSRGNIVWYPNVGKPGDWKFTCARLLMTRDGLPVDVGYGAAPRAIDFDGDGRQDLLVGAERNRVVWYRNTGGKGKGAPELEYMGLVKADDKPLELPVTPVPEGPDVFKLDYYPVLDTVDFDGDGDVDVLAGGYITGRVYLYENKAGRGAAVQLSFAGELLTEAGDAIDVGWAAAPTCGDLDGDGDLDLISGTMQITPGGGDSVSSDKFLFYFENVGPRERPRFRPTKLPRRGEFPVAALATPRLVDFTGDGVLDLVVSANTQVYMFKNAGDARRPEFEAHATALPGVWGNAPLAGTQFLDYDGDDLADGVDAPRVYRNTGRGSPGVFASPISLLKPGVKIDHLSGVGDDWIFQRLYDLDADGQQDLMDADHGGHVWWHRNRGTTAACDFDTGGVRLTLTDGNPLVIAPVRTGFDALQGARATYTVGDFDNDKKQDLVTADTFGEVLCFRQAAAKGNDAPVFEPGQRIAKLRIRAVPVACDWNGDGQADVIAGSSADDVTLILGNKQATTFAERFAPPRLLSLPSAPDGAGAPLVVTDYNGDGDLDIILHTAYGYCCFYERSFIEHGYARGEGMKLETRR